jgi:aspartokinase
MKFGGTSVGSPAAMGQVVDIVDSHLGPDRQVLVVVSAMSGVTDLLMDAGRKAAAGNKWGYVSAAENLRERHHEALNAQVLAGEDRANTGTQINQLIDDYLEVCKAIHILGEYTPRVMDAIVSFGERLSSRVIAATR